jgi:RNA polymerase sigma-70 factor, ECF subfamily
LTQTFVIEPLTEASIDRTQVFVGLLLKAEPQLYAFLRTQIYDRNDADDVFQETAAVLWQKFDEFEPGTNFVAWVCQIARNKVLNYYKNRQRHGRMLNAELLELIAQKSEELGSEIDDMHRALTECMQKLSQADRDILQRCYLSNATIRGVAQDCGRPIDTIKSILKRSRRSLFECIQRTLARESHS